MRKTIILLFIIIIVSFPNVSFAEKTLGDHLEIWAKFGLDAIGIANVAKGVGTLVRVLAPKAGSVIETLVEIGGEGWSLKGTHRKLQDPTGAGWLIWSATTAAEVGSTILETAIPAVRIGSAALGVGYEYYRNWQDEWMEELKEMPVEPYTPILLPPALPLPIAPGRDHPDDYKGVIDSRPATPPADELQRLLKEYDDLSLNYLAFEVGMSIDDPVKM